MPDAPPDWLPRSPLAAVDLGSNSFRLELGQFAGRSYQRLLYLKETVRLGGGLDANGMLVAEAAERGLECLRRFRTHLAGFPPERVRAVATQTLREARNRDEFLLAAQQALGYPIDVISGREEARLIYAGVALLQPPRRPRLVVDIGGRSTELVLGTGHTLRAVESFPVGSVGLSMRYFSDGRLDAESFRAAQIAAGAEFEEALRTFPRDSWSEALGSSGTVGAVAQLLQASGHGDGSITPENLRWCIERCIAAGHVERIDLPGLKADRRPVIPGGLAILYTLAAQFGIDELVPARGALRQGVIVEMQTRQHGPQPARRAELRDHTARSLQRRFGVDAAQAARVANLALSLFDGACPQAAADARRELGWAGALHEVGLMVSHHDHHRHSAYLLAHADAAGFAQTQQRRIASLVLGQRGGLRKLEGTLAHAEFAWQVLCLRLAVIVFHAREAVVTRGVHLSARNRQARLSIPAAWAGRHPRTMHLLAEEAAAWSRVPVPTLELAVAVGG